MGGWGRRGLEGWLVEAMKFCCGRLSFDLSLVRFYMWLGFLMSYKSTMIDWLNTFVDAVPVCSSGLSILASN